MFSGVFPFPHTYSRRSLIDYGFFYDTVSYSNSRQRGPRASGPVHTQIPPLLLQLVASATESVQGSPFRAYSKATASKATEKRRTGWKSPCWNRERNKNVKLFVINNHTVRNCKKTRTPKDNSQGVFLWYMRGD